MEIERRAEDPELVGHQRMAERCGEPFRGAHRPRDRQFGVCGMVPEFGVRQNPDTQKIVQEVPLGTYVQVGGKAPRIALAARFPHGNLIEFGRGHIDTVQSAIEPPVLEQNIVEVALDGAFPSPPDKSEVVQRDGEFEVVAQQFQLGPEVDGCTDAQDPPRQCH